MPPSNAAIVRRIYDAWSRDEFPGPAELIDADVEYVNPEGAIEAGTRRGVTEFANALAKSLEVWEYWRADPEEVLEVGDSVVAVVRYRTRGRGSGVEIEGRESALWTLRDGKVTRYQWFHDVTAAAEAAARRERTVP